MGLQHVWTIVKTVTRLFSSLHQEIEILTPPFESELALLFALIESGKRDDIV